MDSAFLAGARQAMGMAAPVCAECGYDWTTTAEQARLVISSTPEVLHLLGPLPNPSALPSPLPGPSTAVGAESVRPWPVTGYVYHLADILRGWAERWVLLAVRPGTSFVAWSTEGLAAARDYWALPAEPADWALRGAVRDFEQTLTELGDGAVAATFQHELGEGTVGDVLRWLAHECVHHRHDIERLSAKPPNPATP